MIKIKIKHLFAATICNSAFALLPSNCNAQTSFSPIDQTKYQLDFIGNIHVKNSESDGVSSNASEYLLRFAPKYNFLPGIMTAGVYLEKTQKIRVNENFSYGLELAVLAPNLIAGLALGSIEITPVGSSSGALSGYQMYLHAGYKIIQTASGFRFFAVYEYRRSSTKPKDLPGTASIVTNEALPLFGIGVSL